MAPELRSGIFASTGGLSPGESERSRIVATQSTQVGLPFHNPGAARPITGFVVGATAVALALALVGSSPMQVMAPAPSVDVYSLIKVLEAERIGGVEEAPVTPGAAGLDYSRLKIEQQRGEVKALNTSEPSPAKLTE
jgi:hypothetical protein